MPSWAGSKTPLVSTLPVESLSITVRGGTRPPTPITVAAGIAAGPCFVTARPGDAISVMLRLSKALLDGAHGVGTQPGRNSVTVPLTWTRSPTTTAFETVEPKTRIPSEVAGLESGVGSCSQTFEPRSAITTPSTLTAWPANGETCEV